MQRSTILLTAALVAGVTYSVGLKAHLLNREDPEAVLRRGEPAPAIELARLDGTAMDLAEVAGENKLVLVNFWATWCQPCRIEMPQLEKAYEEYREQGFEILAISSEDPDTIERFLEEHPYSFPILLDPGATVTATYGVEAIPTTVLIDAEGKIIRVHTGVSPVLEAQIERYMERDADR